MSEQGKLFDDKDPYRVFRLTAAQRRNGKRGVKRCKMINAKANGATTKYFVKKQKGE